MNKNLTDLYQHKAEETNAQLVSLRSRSRFFILTEVGSFLVAIGFVVLYTLLADEALIDPQQCLSVLYLSVVQYVTTTDIKIETQGGYGTEEYPSFISQ